MSLISVRFAGVPELEACAVDDAAHLVIGAAGPHVRLVQQALLDLGEDIGPAGADGIYGSDTAAAVVQYKSKRSILNVDGQVDGIVGKKTIAALDQEIAVFDGDSRPQVLHTVTFWINAFIPDPSMNPQPPGEPFVTPAPGASTGLSMITIPDPLALGPRFFLGDNRRFSDNPDAPARIHSLVTISHLDQATPALGTERHRCGESVEIDAAGGTIARATAPTDRCRFLHLRGNTSVDPNGGVVQDDPSPRFVQLDYEAAANLPLLAGAPDIDMLGVLQIDRDNNRIHFNGAVDDFPAFEAYVSVNNGPAMILFRKRPVFPLGILGDVKREIKATVAFVPL